MNNSFDVLICCYGDFFEISKKCIDSVINLSSKPLNIHVGLNECGVQTKNYFRELLDNKKITTLIDSSININKDPMMRKLIDCVSNEYFLWLDDDTFPIKEEWVDMIEFSLKKYYDVGGFTHVTDRNTFSGYKTFLESRPWFKSWDKYNEYEDQNLKKDNIPFPIGFAWVGKTKYFIKNNFPDKKMIKKCDDMLLGEMIYQTNGVFYHLGELWNFFEKNSYPRRGSGETNFNEEKPSKILTIYPTGGMCNRIRNFVTAYLLCKENGAKLKFLHETSKDLVSGTKFNDYWHIPDDVDYQNLSTDEIMDIHNREKQKNNIHIRMPSLNNTYHNHWGLCIMESETLEKEGISRLKTGLDLLKLKDEWLSIIKDFVNKYDIKNCIGLHIRSFEFLYGNRNSNQDYILISNFLNKITDQSEKIFLATDSFHVQNQLKKILGERVLIYKEIKNKNYLERNSTEDFEHGLIDFYILGNCRKVFGTRGSSYSHLAGLMAGEIEWVVGSQHAKEWEG